VEQTTVDPGGTTTVVFLAGGDGLLLLMQPATPSSSGRRIGEQRAAFLSQRRAPAHAARPSGTSACCPAIVFMIRRPYFVGFADPAMPQPPLSGPWIGVGW
jgi:hypothetical protein